MNTFLYQNKVVAYSDEGEGQTLVLLHGFCEDSSMWDDFIEYLRVDYRIIRMDLPGLGKSETQEGLSIAGMADVLNALLEDLKIDDCVLIGHSMGGYVSLEFAERHPKKLLGLGIFHSHPYEDSDLSRGMRTKSVEFMERQGHALYVKQLMRRLFPSSYSNEMLLNAMTYKAVNYTTAGVVSGQIAMRNRADRANTLRDFKRPVLFILGKKDDLIPFEQSVEQTYLPETAQIHILSHVGHMGMFEDKDTTERAVRDFLVFCGAF